MSGTATPQEGGSHSQQPVDERTSLLSQNNGNTYDNGHASPDTTTTEDDSEGTDIDPNEFDNLLSRAESISTGLGIEIESQETAMLRGPRRYSLAKTNSRASSHIRSRRKSLASTIGSINEVTSESTGEEDAESNRKSPFLAGVSVGTFWLIFGGVLTGNFVACFDSTIMVSSHPVITSHFNSSNSASWLSTAFLLTSTSFQPLFGRLSDTIGRKMPYVISSVIFLLATLWCGVSQSMTSFIVARAVCGLGAGGMMAMGSIITSDLVPIEIRGVYQSYINIVFGIGSAMGAALGGAIADSLGWRWEFGVQVPFIALCVVASYFTIPRKLGLATGIEKKTLWEAMKVFDFKGSLLLTTSITFLILGLVSPLNSLLITSLTAPEPRRQHLPLDTPHRPSRAHNLQRRLPAFHLHRILRFPTHHAPGLNPAQPTRRPHPRELYRRHHHERHNLQHPALLPSRTSRERHDLWSAAHRPIYSSVDRWNRNGIPNCVDKETEVVVGARRDLSCCGNRGVGLYAEGIAGLGVFVLPSSFGYGTGLYVPCYVHERSRCF